MEVATDSHYGFTLGANEQLSEQMGCDVDVLDFSSTPTGTHKILKATEALTRCWASEYIAITSGNYGLALKKVTEERQKKVHLVITREREALQSLLEGEFTDVHYIEDLQEYNPRGPHDPLQLIPLGDPLPPSSPNLSENHLVEAFRRKYSVAAENLVDITTHGHIECGSRRKSQDDPIYDLGGVHLGERYNHIFVPAGSGELLHDFMTQYISKNSNLYGVSPQDHPFLRGEAGSFPAFYADVPLSRMDKLVTPVVRSRYAHCTWGSGGWQKDLQYLEASEDDSEKADRIAQDAGLNCEPSGAVTCATALSSFRKKHRLLFGPNDRVLLVNTGNGGI